MRRGGAEARQLFQAHLTGYDEVCRVRGDAAPDWGGDAAEPPHRMPLPSALPAVGVDPVLAGLVKGDGTLAREAYRRFERLTLQPLARIAEAELAVKLDAPDLALSFDSLRASDFAGVARSYKALTEAGLSPDAAAGQLDMDL